MKLNTILPGIVFISLAAANFPTVTVSHAQNACPPGIDLCIPKDDVSKNNAPTPDQTRPRGNQTPQFGQGQFQQPTQRPSVQPQHSGQNPFPRQREIQGVPVPGYQFSAPPSDVAERVLQRKIGPEKFNEVMGLLDNVRSGIGLGRGASNADRYFDGAPPRTGNDDDLRPAGTRFFQSGGAQASRNGDYRPATPQGAQQTLHNYGTIPGGIVLEGTAAVLGPIEPVRYNAKLNALTFSDKAVYFLPISPRNLAVLCRAIDRDERIGVSLGQVHIVYGALPADSDVATDLKLADHFLGDIVFARKEWTAGYVFANGFEPRPHQGDRFYGAIFFNFNGFKFGVDQDEVQLTKSNVDVQIVPLLDNKAADGGHLPDLAAISAGRTSSQWELNAKHVAKNIAYYGKEKIIDRVYQYGEMAALIRGLKMAGVDLGNVARDVESSVRTNSELVAIPNQSEPARQLENDWNEYLKQIQAHNYYANWSGPPYDLYINAKRNSFVGYVHRDLPGNDIRTVRDTTLEACASECGSSAQCKAYSFDRWNHWCYLKGELSTLTLEPRSVTGVRQYLRQPDKSDAEVQMYRYRQKAFHEGKELQTLTNVSLDVCEQGCVSDNACIAYTFVTLSRRCILLSDAGEYFTNKGADSGAKEQATQDRQATGPARLPSEVIGNQAKSVLGGVSLCSKIVGEWSSSNSALGVVEFNSNRTMRQGSFSGTWLCDTNRVWTIWNNGFRDQCTLSSNGKSLSCVNNFGLVTSATRR
jgi:hypothetical protein